MCHLKQQNQENHKHCGEVDLNTDTTKQAKQVDTNNLFTTNKNINLQVIFVEWRLYSNHTHTHKSLDIWLYDACTHFSITSNVHIPNTVKHVLMRKITCCFGSIARIASMILFFACFLVLKKKKGNWRLLVADSHMRTKQMNTYQKLQHTFQQSNQMLHSGGRRHWSWHLGDFEHKSDLGLT